MKIVFLVLLLVLSANAQQANELKRECEARALEIAKTLESSNVLRNAIERGSRGDCIRRPWMEKMRKFGIKQASFVIKYSWKNRKVTFKIVSTSYLRFYYSNYDTGRIKDKNLLREIEESGLKQELEEAILAEQKTSAFAVYDKERLKQDSYEANILDDEALPALYAVF